MDDNDIKNSNESINQRTPYVRDENVEQRTPYVRKPKPRKTQEAINDFEQDESFSAGFTHDSNVTVRGRNPLSGTAYSRSRANIPQLQRDLHYGQYLEIPKGKRQIFSSRERSAAIRSRAITAAIIVVLIIVAIIAWRLIAANAAAAS